MVWFDSNPGACLLNNDGICKQMDIQHQVYTELIVLQNKHIQNKQLTENQKKTPVSITN